MARGPNKGGIYGEILLRVGEIPPRAAVNILGKGGWSTLDQYYFDEGELEYFSKPKSCYLVFILRYPKNIRTAAKLPHDQLSICTQRNEFTLPIELLSTEPLLAMLIAPTLIRSA